MPRMPSAIATITSSRKKTSIRSSAQPSCSAADQPPLTTSARLAPDPAVLKSDGQTPLWTGARPEALSQRNQLRPRNTCNSHPGSCWLTPRVVAVNGPQPLHLAPVQDDRRDYQPRRGARPNMLSGSEQTGTASPARPPLVGRPALDRMQPAACGRYWAGPCL